LLKKREICIAELLVDALIRSSPDIVLISTTSSAKLQMLENSSDDSVAFRSDFDLVAYLQLRRSGLSQTSFDTFFDDLSFRICICDEKLKFRKFVFRTQPGL